MNAGFRLCGNLNPVKISSMQHSGMKRSKCLKKTETNWKNLSEKRCRYWQRLKRNRKNTIASWPNILQMTIGENSMASCSCLIENAFYCSFYDETKKVAVLVHIIDLKFQKFRDSKKGYKLSEKILLAKSEKNEAWLSIIRQERIFKMVVTNIYLRIIVGFFPVTIGLILLKIYRDWDKDTIWSQFHKIKENENSASKPDKTYLILGCFSIIAGLVAIFFGFRMHLVGN